MRLLAHFTGDEALRQAFAEDRDIHATVAAQIFGVEEKTVTSEMRRMAKTVNFGVIYGMSGHGLAQRLHIPREEANRFIDAYFARYPKVLDYQARLLKECRKTGYVSTILGRRRRIDGGAIRNRRIRSATSRSARRSTWRSRGRRPTSSSWRCCTFTGGCSARSGGRGCCCRSTTNWCSRRRRTELKRLAAMVQEEMTTPLEKELGLRTPLKVDLAAGPNWLDVDEIH